MYDQQHRPDSPHHRTFETHTPEIWSTNIDGSGTADLLRATTSIAGHLPPSINYRRDCNIWGRSKARLVRSRRSKCLSDSDEGEQQTGQYGEFPHAWRRPPRETQARTTCLALVGSASPPDTLVVAAQQKERTFSAGSLIHTRQNASFPGAAVALGPTPAFRAQLPRRPIYSPHRTPSSSPHNSVLAPLLLWNSLQSCAVLPLTPPVPNFWSRRANSKTRTPTRPIDETKPNPEARRTLFAVCLIHIISFIFGLCYSLHSVFLFLSLIRTSLTPWWLLSTHLRARFRRSGPTIHGLEEVFFFTQLPLLDQDHGDELGWAAHIRIISSP